MLYYSIIDFSSLTDEQTEVLRQSIKKHFRDEKTLRRKESVIARALLCFMLEKCYGLTDFTVNSDKNGKPYIENSDLQFNLSHSGNYVLCVCGEEKVGCDLEKIKSCNYKVAERFFCEGECSVLKSTEASAHTFTKMWTLKESALKFSGNGISGGLDCFDFSEYHKEYEFEMCNLKFRSFEYCGYFVSICSESAVLTQLKADIGDIITDS